MTKGLYIATIIILLVIIILTFLIIYRKKRKTRVIKMIDSLEKEKNLLS